MCKERQLPLICTCSFFLSLSLSLSLSWFKGLHNASAFSCASCILFHLLTSLLHLDFRDRLVQAIGSHTGRPCPLDYRCTSTHLFTLCHYSLSVFEVNDDLQQTAFLQEQQQQQTRQNCVLVSVWMLLFSTGCWSQSSSPVPILSYFLFPFTAHNYTHTQANLLKASSNVIVWLVFSPWWLF